MQRKWITRLKTFGLVFLVAFGINLLFVASSALADYDRLLGQSLSQGTLIGVAYVIVLLWQQRSKELPLAALWTPQRERPQWFDQTSRSAIISVLVVLSVGGAVLYETHHPSFDELWAQQHKPQVFTYAEAAGMTESERAQGIAKYCRGRPPEELNDAEASFSTIEEYRILRRFKCWK